MRAVLVRCFENGVQTTGHWLVFHGNNLVFSCATLEPPNNFNIARESRIPSGIYTVKKHISPKFGPCLWVLNVLHRSEILVHYGNFVRDTLGCILVGLRSVDINSDQEIDITSSRTTLKNYFPTAQNCFSWKLSTRFFIDSYFIQFAFLLLPLFSIAVKPNRIAQA